MRGYEYVILGLLIIAMLSISKDIVIIVLIIAFFFVLNDRYLNKAKPHKQKKVNNERICGYTIFAKVKDSKHTPYSLLEKITKWLSMDQSDYIKWRDNDTKRKSH